MCSPNHSQNHCLNHYHYHCPSLSRRAFVSWTQICVSSQIFPSCASSFYLSCLSLSCPSFAFYPFPFCPSCLSYLSSLFWTALKGDPQGPLSMFALQLAFALAASQTQPPALPARLACECSFSPPPWPQRSLCQSHQYQCGAWHPHVAEGRPKAFPSCCHHPLPPSCKGHPQQVLSSDPTLLGHSMWSRGCLQAWAHGPLWLEPWLLLVKCSNYIL
mmetsp:Transcript_36571/g.70218  ORF Transcript_36571/g.70218 Transcript_36571/m.70218 type:complete len:216 (+) Transcript_36571:302-949(+)